MFIKTRNNLKLSHCQLFSLFSSTFFILSQLELNFVLVGQGRITVWSKEKLNFRLSWIKMYNFCMKQRKKCSLFQDKREMLYSCLASYNTDVGKLCNYCLGIFFLNCPHLGAFYFSFFKTKAFWKEKPNCQTQRFCFFLWHFHHKALCLWLHWNAVFWHFAMWMSG